MLQRLLDVGLIDKVPRHGHTILGVLHLVRRSSRHKEQLARSQTEAVAGHRGEGARSEHWVQAVREHGAEGASDG